MRTTEGKLDNPCQEKTEGWPREEGTQKGMVNSDLRPTPRFQEQKGAHT